VSAILVSWITTNNYVAVVFLLSITYKLIQRIKFATTNVLQTSTKSTLLITEAHQIAEIVINPAVLVQVQGLETASLVQIQALFSILSLQQSTQIMGKLLPQTPEIVRLLVILGINSTILQLQNVLFVQPIVFLAQV
jgi:hypothetical protein